MRPCWMAGASQASASVTASAVAAALSAAFPVRLHAWNHCIPPVDYDESYRPDIRTWL